MDGARLVVRGQGISQGLVMNYDTEKLEIYGQRGGTGTLSVYGGGNAPGINMGSVTVYGGRVKAYGGANAPGMYSTRVEVRGGSLEAFGKNGQLVSVDGGSTSWETRGISFGLMRLGGGTFR